MLAKDVYNTDIQDRYNEDEDEALSLCDLPIYGDDAAENQSVDASSRRYWSSSSSSSSNDDDDDCFEFSFSSSQSLESGWDPDVHHNTPVGNIIFCGKIIHRKEEPLRKNSTIHSSKAMPLMEKSSTRKISAVAANKPSKWYLLMFGLVRIQGHMELRDIKKRQTKRSRRSTPTTFRSNGGDGEIVKNGEIKGKGMWTWSLRAFGCINPSDVDSKVKASLWCVQQLRAGH